MACAHYTPKPVDLEAAPAAYRARRADDPALLSALDSLGAAPARGWGAWSLAHAAWVLSPERPALAAELRAAAAAVEAEGVRPAPGIDGEAERDFSGQDGSSPWALRLSGLFRFELGGKRAARVARAEAAALAARGRLEEARAAAVHEARRILVARTALALVKRADDSTLVTASRIVAAFERRYADGVAGAGELARVRAERDELRIPALAREREERELAAALNARLGMTAPQYQPPPLPDCDVRSALTPEALDSLGRIALTRRPELARVLAEYQEAEGEVRLAVAASWPDLELGPGLYYDHGVGKWTIGFGLPSLPLNAGPAIRAAEARREVAAARVAGMQLTILDGVREAAKRCSAASRLRNQLMVLQTDAAERQFATEQAVQRGEAERYTVDLVVLERMRWLREAMLARRDEALARLELDRALGTWERNEERE